MEQLQVGKGAHAAEIGQLAERVDHQVEEDDRHARSGRWRGGCGLAARRSNIQLLRAVAALAAREAIAAERHGDRHREHRILFNFRAGIRKIAVGAVSTALLVYLIYGALTNAMVTFGDLLSPLSGVAGVSMVINFFQQTAESKADIVTASARGGAVVGAGLLGASNFDNALAMLGNGLLAEAPKRGGSV